MAKAKQKQSNYTHGKNILITISQTIGNSPYGKMANDMKTGLSQNEIQISQYEKIPKQLHQEKLIQTTVKQNLHLRGRLKQSTQCQQGYREIETLINVENFFTSRDAIWQHLS